MQEYVEVKEYPRVLERISYEERATTALLVHGLRKQLAQERTAKESAMQELQERLVRECSAKESAALLADDAALKERPDAPKIQEEQTLRANAAPGVTFTAAESIAARECRQRQRRRGTKCETCQNKDKVRA